MYSATRTYSIESFLLHQLRATLCHTDIAISLQGACFYVMVASRRSFIGQYSLALEKSVCLLIIPWFQWSMENGRTEHGYDSAVCLSNYNLL